jgi:putative DNA primase/helicase
VFSDQSDDVLTASGIDPAWAAEHGVREATTEAELPERLRWVARKKDALPALVFAWTDLHGHTEEQVKPASEVSTMDGKFKYVWAKGVPSIPNVLRTPPEGSSVLFVEGFKQSLMALKYAPESYGVVGLTGCWGWSSGGAPHRDLGPLVNGREVLVIFDADRATNRDVYDAAVRLGEALQALGATGVAWVTVPGGKKTGLDDFLARQEEAERSPVLMRLLLDAKPSPGRKPAAKKKRTYASKFWNEDGLMVRSLAEFLVERTILAVDVSGTVCRYGGGVYVADPDILDALVQDALGEHYRPSHTEATVRVVRTLLRRNKKVLPEYSEEPVVNLRNGMLNLLTLELLDHDPAYLSTVQLPVDWNPDATCPTYDAWIAKQAGTQVDDLEESASLMLDPSRVPTKSLFPYGKSRSGKSTYLRLLEAVAGKANTSAITLHQMTTNRFATAELRGKILNIAADMSAQHIEDMSVYKTLTGEDSLTGERKYRDPVKFRNRALFAFSANHPPTVGEVSTAYLERVKPFKFDESFAGHEDPSLETRMLGELEGILVRLVKANQRFRIRGGYLPTDPAVAADFAERSDRVRMWLKQQTRRVERPDGTDGRTLFQGYCRWARENRFGELGVMKFYDRLEAAGVVEFRKKGTSGKWFRLVLDDSPEPVTFEDENGDQVDDSTAKVTEVTGSVHTLPRARGQKSEEEGEGEGVESLARGRVEPKPVTSVTFTGIDFETPSAQELFRGAHQGPFPRLLGWTNGATSDLDVMRDVLRLADCLATANGWGFDCLVAAHHLGLDVRELIGKTEDATVLAKLAEPPRAMKGPLRDYYDLEHLAPTHLGRHKGDALPKLKRQYGGYDKIPVDNEEYVHYCRLDAELARDLVELLPRSEYYERERRVATLAAELSLRGLRVDGEEVKARMERRDRANLVALQNMTRFGFPKPKSARAKPWTTTQAGLALDKLVEPYGYLWPRTTKGKQDTRATTWERACRISDEVAELADLVLAVLRSGSAFCSDLDMWTVENRVHPQYRIGSATGRWSTGNPNVMGSGKRSELLLADRELVLAEEGEVLISVDLSGIDARAVAGLSGDVDYAALFEPGKDVHQHTATTWFGEYNDAVRLAAKTVSHGINYGRGVNAITHQLTGTLGKYFGHKFDEVVAEVDDMWHTYFKMFPGIKAWQDQVRADARDGGVLDNGFGRGIRTEPDREFTEAPARQAQSCARDLAMEGLFRLDEAGLWDRVRMFLHDEVVLSVPAGDAAAISHQAAELMSFEWTSPSGLVIPIIAEPSSRYGPTWADAYRKETTDV